MAKVVSKISYFCSELKRRTQQLQMNLGIILNYLDLFSQDNRNFNYLIFICPVLIQFAQDVFCTTGLILENIEFHA